MMKKLNKKGFTIVELVIVIAVIAILAAVLIPTFSGVIDKANNSAVEQSAANVYKLYLAENADTEDFEDTLVVKTTVSSKVYYVAYVNGKRASVETTEADAVEELGLAESAKYILIESSGDGVSTTEKPVTPANSQG